MSHKIVLIILTAAGAVCGEEPRFGLLCAAKETQAVERSIAVAAEAARVQAQVATYPYTNRPPYPAVFHISARDGNDAAAGTSPAQAWQTLARVNATPLLPGDRIYLRRGDEWREQLVLHQPDGVVIGAYGEGAPPLINGSEAITGWDRVAEKSDALYAAPLSAAFSLTTALMQVFIDGVRAECARQPNTGWSYARNAHVALIETNIVPVEWDINDFGEVVVAVATTNIFDHLDAIDLGDAAWPGSGLYETALPVTNCLGEIEYLQRDSPGDWSGARAQFLLYAWNYMQTRQVTQMTAGGRTWLVLDRPLRVWHTSRPAFFLAAHPLALDTHGEWLHDIAQQRVYLCWTNGMPGHHLVEAPARLYGVVLVQPRNVSVRGLRIRGTARDGVVVTGGAGCTNNAIEGCVVELAGGSGICVQNAHGVRLAHNTVRGAALNGLTCVASTNVAIVNNTIEETGLVYMPYNNQDGIGIFVNHYGYHTDNEVSGNRVVSNGYIGILFGGAHARAVRNYVAATALMFGEGIGLYTGAWWGSYQHIAHNIIMDSVGQNAPYYRMPSGIANDGEPVGLVIESNIVANCGFGIYVHGTNIAVRGNLLYHNVNPGFLNSGHWHAQLTLHAWTAHGACHNNTMIGTPWGENALEIGAPDSTVSDGQIFCSIYHGSNAPAVNGWPLTQWTNRWHPHDAHAHDAGAALRAVWDAAGLTNRVSALVYNSGTNVLWVDTRGRRFVGVYGEIIKAPFSLAPWQGRVLFWPFNDERDSPLAITTEGVRRGVAGLRYAERLSARGGTPPVQWKLAGGTLPIGVALDKCGVISGVTARTGRHDFAVCARDAAGDRDVRSFTLDVVEPAAGGMIGHGRIGYGVVGTP